jgi:hypothetical protein
MISIPAAGVPLSYDIPIDAALCGLEVDVQAIESDAGAAKGVSFTAGLELIFGS